ncbi:LTA synthase family protein [bacterium]|nr:LTA synthase family protein [bacterium]
MSFKFDKYFWYVFIALFAILFLECSIHWTYKVFGRVNLDEISLTLTLGLGGTDSSFYIDFAKRVFLRALGWAVGLALICRLFKKYAIVTWITFIIVFGILCGRLATNNVQTGSFFNFKTSTFYETEYVNPTTAEISFPQKRNVLVIMLESMEKIYANEDLFGPGGLTPNITQLERNNVSFQHYNSIAGMSRTISAIIGVTTGLPLFYKNHKNVKKMLGATGVGEVLATHGYQTWAMFPASGQFSQKGELLKRMGMQHVIDGPQLLAAMNPKPELQPFSGLEDYAFFEQVRPIVSDIIRQKQPYFIFMETVNTHIPGFYPSECKKMGFGKQNMQNIIKCDDKIITNFVKWFTAQDPNAVVILINDHTTHVNNSILSQIADRPLNNVFINTNIFTKSDTNRPISALDFFPSIIEAAGGKIKGCRLGLGTSLSERCKDTPTLRERYSDAELEKIMQQKNKLYFQLVWGSNE